MRINTEFTTYKIQLSYLKIRYKFRTFRFLFRGILNEKTTYKNLDMDSSVIRKF